MSTPAEAPGGEVLLYEAPDGQVRVDVRLEQETVWLSLDQMAELLGRDKSVISRHLRNVFSTGELKREAVVAKNATTAADGKTYQVDYFNLDAILSVGYRVKSKRGTQFRIWATRTLHDHLLRGYTLNERRLAERGLLEARQTLDLLARTRQNQALVDDTGRAVLHGPDIAIGMLGAERTDLNYRDVVLERRLRPPLVALNPELPHDAIEDAYRKLMCLDAPSLIERNRNLHRMLVDGVTQRGLA